MSKLPAETTGCLWFIAGVMLALVGLLVLALIGACGGGDC